MRVYVCVVRVCVRMGGCMRVYVCACYHIPNVHNARCDGCVVRLGALLGALRVLRMVPGRGQLLRVP